jgi:hypothetical protein
VGISKKLIRITAKVALVLAGWMVIMLAMPFVGPARQVAVVGDRARALRAIAAAGGTVVDVRDGAILARSDQPGFVAALYRNGARLVIEGRIGAGCFSSSPPAR